VHVEVVGNVAMAKAAGMSQTTLSKIWRAIGFKPHLVDSFKLSSDPWSSATSVKSSGCT
jgi:hypothetical protein